MTTAVGSAPLSDISVSGDPLAVTHLAPPRPAHPSTVAEFTGIGRRLAADRERWAPLVAYDAVSRWYHRLEKGPGYEVWLLSWLPGQSSGLHDHGSSNGVFTVLEGTLTEHAVHDGQRRTHQLIPARPGTCRVETTGRFLPPGHRHEVVNDTLESAVSLHVYFPGLTDMTYHPANLPPVDSTAMPAPHQGG